MTITQNAISKLKTLERRFLFATLKISSGGLEPSLEDTSRANTAARLDDVHIPTLVSQPSADNALGLPSLYAETRAGDEIHTPKLFFLPLTEL